MSSGAGSDASRQQRTRGARGGHVGHVDVVRWRSCDVVVMTHPTKDGAYARLALFLELRYGTRQSALIDNRARTSPAERKHERHSPPAPTAARLHTPHRRPRPRRNTHRGCSSSSRNAGVTRKRGRDVAFSSFMSSKSSSGGPSSARSLPAHPPRVDRMSDRRDG